MKTDFSPDDPKASRPDPGLDATRHPRSGRRRRGRARRLLAPLTGIFLVLAGAAMSCAVEKIGVPPRRLSEYVNHRAQGHNPAITAAGGWAANRLMQQDRGAADLMAGGRFRIGAQPDAPGARAPAAAHIVLVDSSAGATAAIGNAAPGDVITLVPGHYRLEGKYVGASRAGTEAQRITVRAERPGTVFLEFSMVEGFLVSAPYWSFENLNITGMCENHSDCEHAFHVVGKAAHFIARNNTVTDFNAHFKINSQGGATPDGGLLEGNTLTNLSIRQTANPVALIDMVAASNWVFRKNLITDFFKGQGNRISYGGFAKGAGRNNRFENNIVLCEYHLRDPGGQQVGLSLGGGGTDTAACRDQRCITEQDASTIAANLIASCADDGIYVNKSATSRIIHNTLIDTGGISVRFPASSADVEGNLVDGTIRVRDNAILRETDNMTTSMTQLFLGSHPVRRLFDRNAGRPLDGKIPRRALTLSPPVPDLCGAPAATTHAYGAFDDFAGCLR